MQYWPFIKSNYRFLSFGFLLVFVGNFGQTFFISIFGGVWREEFNLTHTEYGSLYSTATLLSGFLLMAIGGKLDTSGLRTFTLWVLAGTLLAVLAFVFGDSIWMLFVGFFLIRFCGQGLSGHTAFTSMARYFDKNRGKAISVAAMGMPVGEFLLPALGSLAIISVGWRMTWLGIGLLILVCFLPLLLWSLKDERTQRSFSAQSENESDLPNDQKQWTRKDVIADFRFWIAIPAILSPAMIITGIFFHQAFIAEIKLWTLTSVASAMSLYALSHALGSIYTGALVDRWGAKRMLRVYLIPLALSILFLQSDGIWGWMVFMVLSGLSVGASGPTVGALWPEVYGSQHLGSIRSFISALMVVSTAIAPVLIGMIIDHSVAVNTLLLGIAVFSGVSVMVCQWVYRK